MARRVFSLGVIFGLFLCVRPPVIHAASIGFQPTSQAVPLGTQAAVSLTISGLGAGAAPSVSTYDLNVAFDPVVLSLSTVTFGDPSLGKQLDLLGLGSFTTVTPIGPGAVNLFELSFDLPADLNTLQASAFTLATLNFDTLAVGSSALKLTINALGDAFGDPLMASVGSGSVTVTPEPGTLVLGSAVFLVIVGMRRWLKVV